jgi:CBS domain-containing membrane protein
VLSSIVGVLVRLALTSHVPWLANALGMSLAMIAMQLTTTTHPPGGLTGVDRPVLSALHTAARL